MAAQPAAEVLPVEGGVGGVEAAQGERGTADGGLLGEAQVRIAGEARAEVERDGQGVAPQPAQAPAAAVEDGHVEAVLHGREGGAVDPVEEPAVRGAAAQVDVLAVVDGEAAALEGEGEAAEAGAALQEGDAQSRVGEGEGGGGAGEAPADDDRLPGGGGGHARLRPAWRPICRASKPERPRTATYAFSWPGRETRPRRTASGSRSMRSSRRR